MRKIFPLVRIVETYFNFTREVHAVYTESVVFKVALSKFPTFPEKDILMLFISICIVFDPRSRFDAALGVLSRFSARNYFAR